MTVVTFPIPDVILHERTCCGCHDRVTVYCAFGAAPPQREPYYRCTSCSPSAPADLAKVDAIDNGERQLALVPEDARG